MAVYTAPNSNCCSSCKYKINHTINKEINNNRKKKIVTVKSSILTSSLQISVMKSLASCMALGVGAKIENVSSSTWLIVTPFKKMIYYILKLTCSFQWRKDLTLCQALGIQQ